ncbi:MAG: helix-turn-helix transcriptional regulator [Caulobacteraceae bacterium]
MRHDKAVRLLRLARLLAGSAEGLTLDEMAAALGVGRRTAERVRDAVREVFPHLEEIPDPPTRRFRIPGGLDGVFQSPSAEELSALRGAAELLTAQGAGVRAMALFELERKILGQMRSSARRRIAPDLEALVQAEAIASHAGPRPFEDGAVLAAVRSAITALRALRFVYDGGRAPGRVREVAPCGILFGRSNYLVAIEAEGEPRTWRLDRMRQVEVLSRSAAAPADFSLADYAAESFGVFHGPTEDVVLRVAAERAGDALAWRFHARQAIEPLADGRVEVRFRAAGMLELAWHLFTWGDGVEILQPPSLRLLMVEALEQALARHRPAT